MKTELSPESNKINLVSVVYCGANACHSYRDDRNQQTTTCVPRNDSNYLITVLHLRLDAHCFTKCRISAVATTENLTQMVLSFRSPHFFVVSLTRVPLVQLYQFSLTASPTFLILAFLRLIF